MRKALSTKTIYYMYLGFLAFSFIMIKTTRELYRLTIADLNPMQMVLAGTMLEVSGFLFEIPTGIIADKYSRKLSIILGLLLCGISFIVESIFPIFFVIIVSQFILGLGNTFTSGADEAWVSDELDGENLEHVFLKGAQIGQIFSILGIITAIVIGFVQLNLPYLFGGILYILLALFLLFFMQEKKFIKHESSSNTFNHFYESIVLVKKQIGKKPVLMLMIWISLFYGLFSEGIDRFWTPHFEEDVILPSYFENLNHILYVGIISLFAMLLSILAVEYIKRKLKKTGKYEKVWLLLIINSFMVFTLLGFGLAGEFYSAFSLYISFYMLRKMNAPVYRAWMNQHIESKIRATVLSTYGQIDSLGQIIGGPILGAIALHTTYGFGIVVAAFILSPVIVIYLYFIKRIKKDENLTF